MSSPKRIEKYKDKQKRALEQLKKLAKEIGEDPQATADTDEKKVNVHHQRTVNLRNKLREKAAEWRQSYAGNEEMQNKIAAVDSKLNKHVEDILGKTKIKELRIELSELKEDVKEDPEGPIAESIEELGEAMESTPVTAAPDIIKPAEKEEREGGLAGIINAIKKMAKPFAEVIFKLRLQWARMKLQTAGMFSFSAEKKAAAKEEARLALEATAKQYDMLYGVEELREIFQKVGKGKQFLVREGRNDASAFQRFRELYEQKNGQGSWLNASKKNKEAFATELLDEYRIISPPPASSDAQHQVTMNGILEGKEGIESKIFDVLTSSKKGAGVETVEVKPGVDIGFAGNKFKVGEYTYALNCTYWKEGEKGRKPLALNFTMAELSFHDEEMSLDVMIKGSPFASVPFIGKTKAISLNEIQTPILLAAAGTGNVERAANMFFGGTSYTDQTSGFLKYNYEVRLEKA